MSCPPYGQVLTAKLTGQPTLNLTGYKFGWIFGNTVIFPPSVHPTGFEPVIENIISAD